MKSKPRQGVAYYTVLVTVDENLKLTPLLYNSGASGMRAYFTQSNGLSIMTSQTAYQPKLTTWNRVVIKAVIRTNHKTSTEYHLIGKSDICYLSSLDIVRVIGKLMLHLLCRTIPEPPGGDPDVLASLRELTCQSIYSLNSIK